MDFSFVHPAFLWGLPAAAAPVLLHWLTRPRPKPLPFSSLELLREAVQARLTRSRLRDALLLIVRCLLLAALFLLFSRPVLHWGGAADAEGGMTTVLMLDGSYSMRSLQAGLSAFERAKAAARDLLDQAGPRDRAGLVVFSDRVDLSLPPTEDIARLREALEGLQPTARPTRVGPALESAYHMLQEAEGRRAAVLLSDMAENGWREVEASPARFKTLDPAVRFVAAEMSPATPNAEVSEVTLRADGDGKTSHGWATVRFHGGRAAARGWRVLFGSRAGAQGTLEGEQAPFSFASALAKTGAGSFVLEADALPVDDGYFFPAAAAKDFSVLVVNGSPSLTPAKDEAFFLRSVQSALSSSGVRFQTVPFDAWEPTDIEADVVALLNVRALKPAALAALQAHLSAGRGLWVTGGDNVDPAGPLANLLPGRFVSRSAGRKQIRPSREAGEHPLGRALTGQEGFEWENVWIEELWDFRPAADARVLLVTEPAAAPVLVAGKVLGGAVVVLTTTVDRDWTNLPSKPLFPVLCRQALAFAAGRISSPPGRSLLVGQPFEETLEDASVSSVDILRPDNVVESAAVRGRRLTYPRTDVPGNYRVTGGSGARDLAAFSVNLDAASGEGDPDRMTAARLEKLLPAREVLWVRHSESVGDRFRERVRGKDLTSDLALAALLLFGIETFLAGFLLPRARAAAALLLVVCFPGTLRAAEAQAPAQARGDVYRPEAVAENRFVYAQLRHAGEWDPYPEVWSQFAPTIVNTTSIDPLPERRVVGWDDPALFESPFLVLMGRGAVSFSESEGRALRNYLTGGGLLFLDNSDAEKNSPFARSAPAAVEALFPGARWEALPAGHVIFRSFFLLSGVSGRRIVEPELKGLRVQDRIAAVYCANDLHGALARDRLGNPLYSCEPGGETQRLESMKLLLNVVLFSLTGTYKTDAIHQPFLEQKLRQ